MAQYLCIAGFQTQIDHFQSEVVQELELLRCLAQNRGGRAVARHAGALRDVVADKLQNDRQILGLADECIAVREEYALNVAIGAARNQEVLQNVLHLADVELLFLVHITKRAFVVAASDRNLYNQAVCLARRAEYASFVSHNCPPDL